MRIENSDIKIILKGKNNLVSLEKKWNQNSNNNDVSIEILPTFSIKISKSI